jgi:cytochrome c
MRDLRRDLVSGLLLALACLSAQAAPPPWTPGLGVVADPLTVADQDLSILPDGRNLPPGRGSVAEGAQIYTGLCIACHGAEGLGGANGDLAGGIGSLATESPVKTVGSYWPYATTLFDYVRRAMPYTAPGSLSDDDVYAVVAYVLHLGDILPADAVLDAGSLAAVRMPNRDGFVWAVPQD